MRVFRDHDDDHEHDDDHGDEQPGTGINPDEIFVQAELLADEIADFLTETVDEADQPRPAGPTTQPVPVTTTPQQSTTAAPVEPRPAPTANPYTRGQIWRASAAGSFVVVGLAAIAAWGQPAEVGAPAILYGLGWLAYLNWNAARRPSPSLALAAFTERRAVRVHRNNH
ncbi:hypothetical protein [Nocardia sp. NPDC056100]|uniref:hypothetical protein n=1 Tax=Nocardia sp. NPDC056100 TaxID=3345712 RepID=UPI0035DFA49E